MKKIKLSPEQKKIIRKNFEKLTGITLFNNNDSQKQITKPDNFLDLIKKRDKKTHEEIIKQELIEPGFYSIKNNLLEGVANVVYDYFKHTVVIYTYFKINDTTKEFVFQLPYYNSSSLSNKSFFNKYISEVITKQLSNMILKTLDNPHNSTAFQKLI